MATHLLVVRVLVNGMATHLLVVRVLVNGSWTMATHLLVVGVLAGHSNIPALMRSESSSPS